MTAPPISFAIPSTSPKKTMPEATPVTMIRYWYTKTRLAPADRQAHASELMSSTHKETKACIYLLQCEKEAP